MVRGCFLKGDDAFCREDILENAFYKTEHTMAIYDIAPVMPGHSLIIPRRHVLDITELRDDELRDLFTTIKKVKPVILRIYGDSSESYNLTAQIGEYSGGSVRHLHLHLIPRKMLDPYQSGSRNIYSAIDRMPRLTGEEHKRNVELLRRELKWRE